MSCGVNEFQLTRPVWGEPPIPSIQTFYRSNFNSLAPCGANPYSIRITGEQGPISTHSPRVGRTVDPLDPRRRRINFNSLAPCGANLWTTMKKSVFGLFQLTRPVWGEPKFHDYFTSALPISTHSPRVGRTAFVIGQTRVPTNFNSLAPCGANPVHSVLAGIITHFNSLAPCGANLSHRL